MMAELKRHSSFTTFSFFLSSFFLSFFLLFVSTGLSRPCLSNATQCQPIVYFSNVRKVRASLPSLCPNQKLVSSTSCPPCNNIWDFFLMILSLSGTENYQHLGKVKVLQFVPGGEAYHCLHTESISAIPENRLLAANRKEKEKKSRFCRTLYKMNRNVHICMDIPL